jgi:hypothetical protein
MASMNENQISVNQNCDINKISYIDDDAHKSTNEKQNSQDLIISYEPTDYSYLINSHKENDFNIMKENQNQKFIQKDFNAIIAPAEDLSRLLECSKDNLNVWLVCFHFYFYFYFYFYSFK